MRRDRNLFSLSLLLMTLQGMGSPSNRVLRIISIVWRYVMLYLGLHFVMITFLAIFVGGNSFYVKCETFVGTLTGISMVYRHFVLVFNQDKVLSLIRRINALANTIADTYGQESLDRWERLSYAIMYASSFIVTFTTVPAYLYSYYKFYTEGIVTAPYEVYMPFQRENNVHGVVFYEALSFIDQPTTLVVSNTFVGTIIIVISGITETIRARYEEIHPSNIHLLKQTINWHSEVICIVEEMNAFLGSAIMVDCLLSIVHISVSGYLLVKAGFENGTDLHKYIFLYLLCLTMPSFFCACGHVISQEKDKLHISIYQNAWYELSVKDRKDLILPSKIAFKGLTLHYRRMVEFDLPTYLSIIKQSYSFIAILKLMDV